MVGFDVSQWLRSFCIKKKMDGEGLREREREREKGVCFCVTERESLGLQCPLLKRRKVNGVSSV